MICVLTAGMLWGCMGILVRTMNEGGFDSLEITAFRSLVTAALMLAGMALFKRKELRVKWKDLWCFAGTGILSVAFFNVCYFTCMNYATLSVAAYLLYTAGLRGMENGRASIIASIEPVMASLVGFFLYKEAFSLPSIIGMIFVLTSCVLVG